MLSNENNFLYLSCRETGRHTESVFDVQAENLTVFTSSRTADNTPFLFEYEKVAFILRLYLHILTSVELLYLRFIVTWVLSEPSTSERIGSALFIILITAALGAAWHKTLNNETDFNIRYFYSCALQRVLHIVQK